MLVAAVAAVFVVVVVIFVFVFIFVFVVVFVYLFLLLIPLLGRWEVLRADRATTFVRVCFCAIRATLFDCSKATHTSANISTPVTWTQGKLGRA